MAASFLRPVASQKLSRLDASRSEYEKVKKTILDNATSKSDALDKTQALLEEMNERKLGSVTGLPMHTLERLVKQARTDPSVAPEIIQQWQTDLIHALDVKSSRYKYASLFSGLVTEWLSNPNDVNKQLDEPSATQASNVSSDDSSDYEPVGRTEMHEQRDEWESLVFTEHKIDTAALEAYLTKLYDTGKTRRSKKTPLEDLRAAVKEFKVDPLNITTIGYAIKGVLKSDLFAGQKRDALLDLQTRPAVLQEMVDILNMDLANLHDFTWEPSPVPVHQRRQLNGKYRVFMDEDLHQALLLQHVGASLGVCLKGAFTSFFHTGFRQVPPTAMTKHDRLRRTYFLADMDKRATSVKDRRRSDFIEDYLLTQLPNTLSEGTRDYGQEEEEADQGDEIDEIKSPLEIKQGLLRLATTEMLLHLETGGDFAILQTDMKWFGPSLPHATIETVLRFFGMTEKLLQFTKKYLETPLIFSGDGPNAATQLRRCGIPMSHVLSDSMAEAAMFCLDFAVNQATKGRMLYRFHDDIWMWGKADVCVAAWTSIQEFTKVMGMELNEEKTGSIQIFRDQGAEQPVSGLPDGTVTWGFLRLDASKRAWVIDQDSVEKHISELRRQLAACRSVFAWIEAWNSYVSRFFTTNLGDAANCFGKPHEEMIISTFAHIQTALFPSGGGVSAHVKKLISDRFDAQVLDAFLYFPIELGGLGLRNPFIPHLARLGKSLDKPRDLFDDSHDRESDDYEARKRTFDSAVRHASVDGFRPADEDKFMSFDEFVRYREETSEPVLDVYVELQEQADTEVVRLAAELERLAALAGNKSSGDAETYRRWIIQLYGPKVVETFGTLSIGDKEWLPLGLVNMMRSEKTRWQG